MTAVESVHVTSVNPNTGEVIELRRDLNQTRLLGDFEAVEAFELAITGASGLVGSEDLTLGHEVRLEVRGRVIAVTQQIKTRKGEDGEEEVLVRIAKVKAISAKVTKPR